MTDIQITCAFAPTPDNQLLTIVTVKQGETVVHAIEQTGWLTDYPHIKDLSVGIFSQKVDWQTPLKNGDRIEIYRPLTLDPITRRSLKRELKKKQKK